MPRILRIDASMRQDGSVTRTLTDEVIAKLADPSDEVITRDLAEGVDFIDAAWIGATFTPADARTPAQRAALASSDRLVEELEIADTIVIGLPIYNFSAPAAFKAWVDMVARAGRTFRYTEAGPQGLLTGKSAHVVVASGGVAMDGAADFATPWLRQVLGFLGVHDVTIYDATGAAMGADAALARARAQIEGLSQAA